MFFFISSFSQNDASLIQFARTTQQRTKVNTIIMNYVVKLFEREL